MIVKTLLQQTRLDKYTRIFVQIFIQSGPIKSFRKSLMEEFKFILPVLRFLMNLCIILCVNELKQAII